jgi:membrane-associated HD superfamily phosphohydrolase
MFIPRTLTETEGGGGRGPWARALIVGVLLAASLWAIMSVNVATGQVNLAVGDVAQTEIRAPISRSFVSESQTNAAREEAADQVATVYVPIAPLADIADQQLRAYDAVVGGITTTLEQRDAGSLADEEVPDELNRIAPQLTDEQVDRLSAISLVGWQRISDAGREVLEAIQSEEIRADEITDAREQLRTNITQDLVDVDRELAGDLAEDYVAANYEA